MGGLATRARVLQAMPDWIRRASFIIFGVWVGLAFIYVKAAPPEADWRLFYDTGVLVVSGRTSDLYPGVTPGYPFLYPPPLALLVSWLGLLSPVAAHVSLVLVMAMALCAALWILHKALDDRGRSLASWAFVVLSSAACLWMMTAGHIAAWFLLLIAAALFLWMRGREFAAGFALGLMAIKPNYCIPFLGCLVLARAWRVLGGSLAAIALLALSTWPLGGGVWASYFAHAFGTAGKLVATVPAWKQITLLSFWRSVIGDGRPIALICAAALSILPCLVLVALAWLKRGRERFALPRLFALTVLMMVSCNAYSFLYDGMLLAAAGAIWFLRGQEYASQRRHHLIGALVFLVYVALYVPMAFLHEGISATGPLVAAWLIIDALDLLVPTPSPRLASVA